MLSSVRNMLIGRVSVNAVLCKKYARRKSQSMLSSVRSMDTGRVSVNAVLCEKCSQEESQSMLSSVRSAHRKSLSQCCSL